MTITIPYIHPSLPDLLETVFNPSKVINKKSTLEDLKIATGHKEIIDYLRSRVADQNQEEDQSS